MSVNVNPIIHNNLIIPNELKIIIKTGIPGYQKFIYKPNMTVKNANGYDKKVHFNPLVKINQNDISKTPVNLKQIQFVNESLFNSLVLSSLKTQKKVNIETATKEGYVDNNIKITLDTLFPANNVIYINNKPYVILDTLWTKSDWKIDTKIKQISKEDDYINYGYNLSYDTINKELHRGTKQMEKLPNSVIYGKNYEGKRTVYNNASTTNSNNKTKKNVRFVNTTRNTIPTTTIPTTTNTSHNKTKKVMFSNTNIPPTTTSSSSISETTTQLTPPPKPPKPPKPANQQNMTNSQNNSSYMPIPLNVAQQNTNDVKAYFNSQNFYKIMNELYSFLNDNAKELIASINHNYDDNDINQNESYKKSVDRLKIIKNTGAGDCFFIAVADAVNYYNATNASKINHSLNHSHFTQSYLRKLVYDEYIKIKEKNLNEGSPSTTDLNVSTLNDLFKNEINGIKTANIAAGNTEEETKILIKNNYNNYVQSVYANNDNFLVKVKDNLVTDNENDQEYYKPYRPMTDAEIEEYITSSNYWANDLAIAAMASQLKLNVIVIVNNNNKLSIPFGLFDNNHLNEWDKYLFLYNYNGHYELMTFDCNTVVKSVKQTMPIFERDVNNSLIPDAYPPFYILTLIFASNYLKTQEKQNFSLEPELFQQLDDSYKKILKPNNNTTKDFQKAFTDLFGVQRGGDPRFDYLNRLNAKRNAHISPYDNGYYNPGYRSNGYYNPGYHSNSYYNPGYRSNSYYNPGYRSNSNHNNVLICYYVTINLELHEGTKITPDVIKNLSCDHKWNSIKQAYYKFIGKPYNITPIYKTKAKTKTKTNKIQNLGFVNKTRKRLSHYY